MPSVPHNYIYFFAQTQLSRSSCQRVGSGRMQLLTFIALLHLYGAYNMCQNSVDEIQCSSVEYLVHEFIFSAWI